MLKEPQQGLPDSSQLGELLEHQQDGLLYPKVRVLLKMLLVGLDIAGGSRHNELATLSFLPPRLQGALAQ